MKIWIVSALMMIFAGMASAQTPGKLTAIEFDAKMKSTPVKIVLDVRTQDEFSDGHLANAILIDIYQSDFKDKIGKLDKAKPVFVYCKMGGRSKNAADQLIEAGFKQVYDLQGGIVAWKKAEKAIVH